MQSKTKEVGNSLNKSQNKKIVMRKMLIFFALCFIQLTTEAQTKQTQSSQTASATESKFTGSITVGGNWGWDMKSIGETGYFQGVWWLLATKTSKYYLEIAPWDYAKVVKIADGVTVIMDNKDRPFSNDSTYIVYGKIMPGKYKLIDSISYKIINDITKIITKPTPKQISK